MSRNGKGRLRPHQAPEGITEPPAWAGWARIDGQEFRVYGRYGADGGTFIRLQFRKANKKPGGSGRAAGPSQKRGAASHGNQRGKRNDSTD